jgi:hypothetical protein
VKEGTTRRKYQSRAWERVGHHQWRVDTDSIFFVLCHVPVGSACINIFTQDRGTRVPPVKCFRIYRRQALRVGMSESGVCFLDCFWTSRGCWNWAKLELDWELELDSSWDWTRSLTKNWTWNRLATLYLRYRSSMLCLHAAIAMPAVFRLLKTSPDV